MFRRSLLFMLTGLLIAVPILLTAYAAQTDWSPNNIAMIAVVTVASVGIMTLIDELGLDRRIGAEGIRQRGPRKAETR
jgi:hypothetical protein